MKTKDTLRTISLAIASILFIASCSKQDGAIENITPQGDAISFAVKAVSASEATTRATGEINNISNLQSNSFGVFASYTGLHKYSDSNVSSDFIYNEEVSYDPGEGWTYSPVRYWPNGEGEDAALPHYVSFFAYAPYNSPCISDVSNAHETGDPWITYKLAADVANQEDLLYAMQLDQTKQAIGDCVTFEFQHALACVGDRVTISMSDELETALGINTLKLTDVSIDYTLTAKAKLVLWNNGTANWLPILSENATVVRSVSLLSSGDEEITTSSPWEMVGEGVFYIPLTVGDNTQKAEVHISYDVYDKNDTKVDALSTSGTVTLKLSDYADAYKAGKQLDIDIILKNLN